MNRTHCNLSANDSGQIGTANTNMVVEAIVVEVITAEVQLKKPPSESPNVFKICEEFVGGGQ